MYVPGLSDESFPVPILYAGMCRAFNAGLYHGAYALAVKLRRLAEGREARAFSEEQLATIAAVERAAREMGERGRVRTA